MKKKMKKRVAERVAGEKNKKYRILFMGTPDFGCASLEALISDPEIEVPLVISQPDTKRGRKMKLTPSPIKQKALDLGLLVETPEKVSSPDYIEKLSSLNLDAVLVLAYGQLLKQDLLDVLPGKFINIHASLLPRWRGAAPIQRALMAGDEETGLSFQVMQLKLDSGPIVFEKKVEVDPNENSVELAKRLSVLSADLVCDVVKGHINEAFKVKSQNEEMVTYAKKIEKSEGLVDWSKPARELHNQIRGLQWGPGAYTQFKGKRLKLSKTEVKEGLKFEEGVLHSIEESEAKELTLWIGTAKGLLGVNSVQPEGKPPQKVKDFVNGYGLTLGQRFS